MDQWSLYVDIEGFSATYAKDARALLSLGALMEGIYRIGTHCLAESPHRIFALQLGDGFIVVGEFGCQSLEQPVSIGIALLRVVVEAGGAAKAAVSEGQFSDIVGCYPRSIREAYYRSCGGAFPIGGGLMTVLPVMGSALINSYRLLHAADTPSGCLLVLKEADAGRLPAGVSSRNGNGLAILDWVHASYSHLRGLLDKAGFARLDSRSMARALRQYLDGSTVTEEWRRNTVVYLNLETGV